MTNKKGVVMYYDILEQLEDFTDEQFGKITRAIIKYDQTGETTEFDDPILKMAFKILKPTLDRNKKEYEEKCEKNRQNVLKRWGKDDTNEYDRIRMNTNDTDTDIDTDKDIDKENIIKESQADLEMQTISINQADSLNALTRENIITNQADIEKQSVSVKQTLPHDSAIEKLYTYWNTLNIVVHRKLTPNIIKAIKKALESYTEEEIKNAMNHYNKVLKDKNYYFDYVWGLDTFLKQKNCLPHFVDSGEKWLSYCAKTGTKAKEQKQTEYKIDESGVISL